MNNSVTALHSNAYTWEKRMEVVSLFMLLGNLRVVSEQSGVHYQTLLEWKKSDWWPDMVATLRRQKKQKTSDSLVKIVETSLDALQDRLENGDFVLNNKTGQIVRKPVSAKDAQAIANNLLQRQIQLEEVVHAEQNRKETIQDTLQMLATEFKKWNKNQLKASAETIDFKERSSLETIEQINEIRNSNAVHDEREERLQEGSSEIHQPAGGSG